MLSSAAGQPPRAIAAGLRCARQTARNAIRAFNADGLAALTEGSSRPKSAAPVLDGSKLERLRAILHQSPRVFGQSRSTWTLTLLAQVAHAQRVSPSVAVGRDDPPGSLAPGRGLEAGQALADQPRP